MALPDRLDRDPQVLWGCTSPELYALFALSFAFWGPLTLVVVAPFGMWVSWCGLAPLLTALTAAVAARRLRKGKRGKTEQQFRQELLLLKQRLGLIRPLFITRCGYWSLGRTGCDVS